MVATHSAPGRYRMRIPIFLPLPVDTGPGTSNPVVESSILSRGAKLMTDEEYKKEQDKRTGPNGVLYDCATFCEEFPPYPEDWIILEEDLVDEVFESSEYGPAEHHHYKAIKFAVIADGRVGVNWATCWLTDDFPVEWKEDPDSGASLTVAELKGILDLLGPDF